MKCARDAESDRCGNLKIDLQWSRSGSLGVSPVLRQLPLCMHSKCRHSECTYILLDTTCSTKSIAHALQTAPAVTFLEGVFPNHLIVDPNIAYHLFASWLSAASSSVVVIKPPQKFQNINEVTVPWRGRSSVSCFVPGQTIELGSSDSLHSRGERQLRTTGFGCLKIWTSAQPRQYCSPRLSEHLNYLSG